MAHKHGSFTFQTLFLSVITVYCVFATKNEKHECQNVRNYFVDHKLGHQSSVPDNRIYDPSMIICYDGSKHTNVHTCCSRNMEKKFLHAAQKEFTEGLKATTIYIKNLLTTNAANYKDEFSALVQGAENATDKLFKEVYKIPINARRSVLRDFFLELQESLKRHDVNIHDSVTKFFDDLFPLVFHNILSDPTMTEMGDKYRECLMGLRKEVYPHPFGDMPHKLTRSLSKVLSAARTFLEALNVGETAINATSHFEVDTHCAHALTKMRYCSQCHGHVAIRPCEKYCHNVMRGCLTQVQELDKKWKSYVHSFSDMSKKEGLKTIEEVFNTLQLKISEAIMHAMENTHKLYTKVVQKCGQPTSVRQGTPMGIPMFNTEKVSSIAAKPAILSVQSRLNVLVNGLLSVKNFYHDLADNMCKQGAFTVKSPTDRCWNGHQIAPYLTPVSAVNYDAQLSNPEVKVTLKKHDDIENVKSGLHKITGQMVEKKSEGKQHDEYWVYYYPSSGQNANTDDEDYGGSGSGQGSGGGRDSPSRSVRPSYVDSSRNRNGQDDGDGIYIDQDLKGGKDPQQGKNVIGKDNAASSSSLSFFASVLALLICVFLQMNG